MSALHISTETLDEHKLSLQLTYLSRGENVEQTSRVENIIDAYSRLENPSEVQ